MESLGVACENHITSHTSIAWMNFGKLKKQGANGAQPIHVVIVGPKPSTLSPFRGWNTTGVTVFVAKRTKMAFLKWK